MKVVEVNNISATCVSLYSTRGLQKGSIVLKKADELEVEYSDKILGRIFDSYGNPIDGNNKVRWIAKADILKVK